MVNQFHVYQAILGIISVAYATELLPERYLKPQNFNHHPFTDVGIPAALKKASVSPYAVLSKKKAREGREFPIENIIFYPTLRPSVISRKHVETNEINKFDDPYVNVPKNYAFSYTVKDQNSGDDFSHSQAHNGKATKGQYRVKLPDGRTQIVSYTADHKGYRADVQYEEELISKHITNSLFPSPQNIAETPTKLPEILPGTYLKLHPELSAKHNSHFIPQKSTEAVYNPAQNYKQNEGFILNPSAATPVQYVNDNAEVKFLIKSTIAPHYYQTQYPKNYISTTSGSYSQPRYITSSESVKYLGEHFVSSTPLYPVTHVTATTASPVYKAKHYQDYHQVSSTVSPQQAVIVTPRPLYNQAVVKNEHQSGLLFRIL